MPIIIDTGDDRETLIIRKNEYCILVNSKVLVLSIDGEEWLCDEKLTQEEFQALQIYFGQV